MPDKPRVGIMSMQRIRNYGSFLQAYGLKRMLEDLGCEVCFVDYHPGRCLVEPPEVTLATLGGKGCRGFGWFRVAIWETGVRLPQAKLG